MTAVVLYGVGSRRQQLLDREYQVGKLLVASKVTFLEERLADFDDDARLLTSSPTLQGFLSDQSGGLGSLADFWKGIMTRTGNVYRQGCVLDGNAVELVCMVKSDSEHTEAVTAGLQDVSGRKDIVALRQVLEKRKTGSVSLAAFDVVVVPGTTAKVPVLRFDRVVRGDDNASVVAIICLEAKLETILGVLDTGDADTSFSVVDVGNGEFVYGAPSDSALYGVTGGSGETIYSLEPHDAQTLLSNKSGVLGESVDRPGFIEVYAPIRV